MKLELSDGISNHSDFSNDSQNSQMSTADFMTTMANGGLLLTPTSAFITLEGLNSGVPTRTTATLTPTTLRNIEQTFIELQAKPEPHENEAGFVPPLVHSIGNNQYIPASEADVYSINNKSPNAWQSSLSQSSSDSNTRSTSPFVHKQTSLAIGKANGQTATPTRRNMGGRKPVKDLNISPEEEERRKIRRERNKAAAARCRKRRVDHTNALIKETEELEKKKQALQNEYQNLKEEKDELEYLLQNHLPHCNLKRSQSPPDIKPPLPIFNNPPQNERVKTEMVDPLPPQVTLSNDVISLNSPTSKKLMLPSAIPISKPCRPNSLNVCPPKTMFSAMMDGISITTPSTGLQFNFDSMMGGGTGLTPVSGPLVPSCSTQQRNLPVSITDISSPDACGPPKLNTQEARKSVLISNIKEVSSLTLKPTKPPGSSVKTEIDECDLSDATKLSLTSPTEQAEISENDSIISEIDINTSCSQLSIYEDSSKNTIMENGKKRITNIPTTVAKRRNRRERNRLAAARCRKRQLDRINSLEKEEKQLKMDNQKLKKIYQNVKAIRDELQMNVDKHRAECTLKEDHAGKIIFKKTKGTKETF